MTPKEYKEVDQFQPHAASLSQYAWPTDMQGSLYKLSWNTKYFH